MLIKASRKTKKEVYEVAMVVAVVQPLMVLPQALQIYNNRSAADVSLLTWAMLLIFNVSNLIYGLVFRIKPLIINNAIWVIVDAAVVAGILIYK